MAGWKSVADAASGGKKVTAMGPMSGLRYAPDGTAIIEPPRTTAPGTSYEDEVFKQFFDTKSPKRAQKTRKLDPKTGTYVAGTSEETLRNRPDFILQGMLSADSNERLLIKRLWDRADKDQKKILAQEIAEAFPDAQGQAPGGSPVYREIMSFLRTGEISPERMEILRQEADLANADPRVRRQVDDLPPGHPDRAAVTEDMSGLDQEIQFEPDSKVPGDPLLDAGPRAFGPPEGVDTTHLRDDLDARPYLRGQETVSVRGDKINPKKERFDTGMVEGAVEPTPEEIAAHRTAWMRSKIAEITPDHPRLNELTPEFMEQVLTSRGIAIEPGMPPARRQMPVRVPQGTGTIGPQDAGRILAGEKYQAADAARTARMEQAIAEEFGMDIEDVREQFRRLQESGDAEGLKEMQAQAKLAIQRANLGPYPQKPYDRIGRESDIRAASSVAEGGEQRMLADALDQLGRGQLGGEDRVFRMLVKKASRDLVASPAQAGLPTAEAMADYALSLIRNPDILGRIAANKGYETWRQQIIDALDNRFYRQDQPPRVLTKEEAARIDAEIDAQAGDPDAEWGVTELRPNTITDQQRADYEQAQEDFQRKVRSPGYMGDDVPLAAAPTPPRIPNPATPAGPDGNVGRLGVPQGLRASQAADAYPQGIDQYGRPVSAIEGRNPTGGRKNPGHRNSPVDRYPGSEGLENLSDAAENIGTRRVTGVPISPEPDTGILSTQASALENSIGYANQRGKVVWQDPETGNIMAAYITPKMKPERVAEIRENARALATSSGDVFDYYWPEGGLPRPDYHRWNLGEAADAVPEGYVPPSATAPPRDMSPVEPMPPATPRPYADVPASTLKQAEGLSQELGASMTEDGPLPPGVRMGLDGRYYRSAFEGKPGLFADEMDPNDILAESTDVMDEMPATPNRQALDDATSEAWNQQGRTVLDADGNEIPLEAAAAEDLAREVARIISDPSASPEDLQWAMGTGRELQLGYDRLPDAIKPEYKQDVLDPIEQEAAGRNKPTQQDSDLGELPPDDSESATEVFVDDTPAVETSPNDVVDSVDQNLEAAATPVATEPVRQPVKMTVGEVLDAARRSAADDPNSPDYIPDVNGAGVRDGSFTEEQPSVQSADNAKPQEPPKPAEDAARQQANAQKQASDIEAEKADAETQADAATRQAEETQQAVDETTGATPDPKKPYRTRIKEHFQKNYGKYGLAAGAGYVGLNLYHGGVTSDPYPNALDPVAGGPGEDPMESLSPEERIRMMIRSRYSGQQNSNPYPVQTLWRQY